MGLSVGEEATAKTAMTDRNYDKVLHTMSTAVCLLTQCSNMCIISQRHSQTHTIPQHGCQRDDALPRQISGILNTSRDRTCTRCADTDGTNGLKATILLNERQHFLCQCLNIFTDIRIIRRGEIILCDNLTTDINHSKCSFLHTNINTHHTGLNHIYGFCFHYIICICVLFIILLFFMSQI